MSLIGGSLQGPVGTGQPKALEVAVGTSTSYRARPPVALDVGCVAWRSMRARLRQQTVHDVRGTAEGLVGGVDHRVDERVGLVGRSVSGPAHGVDDRIGR